MNKKKSLIVIGGNRANNFETFAPIVYDLRMKGYDVTALFQNESIKNLIVENKVLNLIYDKKKILSNSHYNLIKTIKLIFYLSRYKNGIILTNRFFISFKFKIIIKILKFFNYKTIYTKSFSRPPTRNIFALVGPIPKVKNKTNLCDFCLLPTKEHILEYALLGYRYSQMIISGYPKMNRNWIKYCTKIIESEKINKIDILVVLGIYHEKYGQVVKDIIFNINGNFSKINICLKPHPTTKKEIIDNLIRLVSNNNSIILSNQNVLGLSYKSKIIITHGTSSSIDASCVSENVYCYWGEQKKIIEEYKKNTFNDKFGFEILESNLLSEPFVNSSLYTKDDLNNFFKKLNINEIKQNLVNSNLTDNDITEKIENKIFL